MVYLRSSLISLLIPHLITLPDNLVQVLTSLVVMTDCWPHTVQRPNQKPLENPPFPQKQNQYLTDLTAFDLF